MSGARSGGLDAVRVAALVAVVAGHVWLSSRVLHDAVFAWHVPVFFFLTGLLERPGRTTGEEARKRIRSIGLPYVVWLAVLLAAYATVQGPGSWPSLGGIASGLEAAHRPFHTFWFLSSLLVTAVLARLLSPLALRWQLVVALGGAIAGTLAGPALARTPLAVGTAVFCLPFVIAGVAAQRVLPRIRRRAAVGAALVAAGAIALLLGAQPVDLKAGDVGTPVLGYALGVAVPAGLVLLAEALFDRLPEAAGRVATALALPAVVVLLLHPVVLWLLRTPSSGRVLDFALCLLVPWAVGLLVVRSPLAPVLAGTARVRRPRRGGVGRSSLSSP
ncbi:acyltransferase family protein [Amnibacterium endophyticum]|uniref:Acyltransferase family protein n=1 Tax=Amnibacterium endophyticum TaxID=2109337 RepID=A0ABW4LHF2_9MICO